MIDIKSLSASSKRFGKAMSPLLVGVFLAGCNAATPAKTNRDAMMESSSSSSVDAMMMESSSSSAETMMDDPMMMDSAMMNDGAMMHTYNDGAYSAAGVYRSPAGAESVTVSLILKDDVIIDATFIGDATHKKSIAMQAAFTEGFNEQVVGKSLDEVSVGVVNGSSLTGVGFMDAVAKIKVEAKA